MADKFDYLRKIVQEELDYENSGHDYAHVMRVFKNAVFIAQYVGGADMDVLKAAALLHDLSYGKRFYKKDAAERSANLAKQRLSTKSFTKKNIERIVYAIQYHDVWTKADATAPVELKILRDADRLDYLGYTGIIRAIAYATETNKRYIDCLYEWLELKNSFETSKGKALSKPRVKVMNNFIKKLEAEY